MGRVESGQSSGNTYGVTSAADTSQETPKAAKNKSLASRCAAACRQFFNFISNKCSITSASREKIPSAGKAGSSAERSLNPDELHAAALELLDEINSLSEVGGMGRGSLSAKDKAEKKEQLDGLKARFDKLSQNYWDLKEKSVPLGDAEDGLKRVFVSPAVGYNRGLIQQAITEAAFMLD